MAMSWTAALGGLDDSLESALARRQVENSGLMKILQQTEGQRENRVAEADRSRSIDENAKWRMDQNLQRAEDSIRDDHRAREMQKAAIQAKADADKQRADDKAEETKIRREAQQQRDKERAQDRAERDKERAAAKAEAEEAKARKDDPTLPRGVTNWLAQLPFEMRKDPATGQAVPMDLMSARKKVRDTWGQLQKDHPSIDAMAVGRALDSVFVQPNLDRQVAMSAPPVQMRNPETGQVGPVDAANVQAALENGYSLAQ